ncbi:MAG: hypothetical protein ISR87_01655 [Candidatus Marinimicrobia bacterium]|nr:hypothetical protein [FCB group bacterium]MBL7024133.1 hypothetical protein [Candidatus Neomarinimicrobiota bacterium]
MASVINLRLKDRYISPFKCQTIELRSADGSAFIHLLLAGLTMAIQYGLRKMDEHIWKRAQEIMHRSIHVG